MDRLKTILVAVEFSPCSQDALRQAARIAAWTGASVSALHVINFPARTPLTETPLPLPVHMLEGFTARARKRWLGFTAECGGCEKLPLAVELGHPRDTILDHVARDKPDLLILGANSSLERQLPIGTTASACVQRAGTRVMVVRRGQSGAFKSIVVCVDCSEASMVALEQAIRIAAQDNAELHILYVYQYPWGLSVPEAIRTNMPDYAERYRASVESHLRQFCYPLAHEIGSLQATYHALQSQSHGDGIIAFAQTHGCDLVILGTRGKWNLRDYFFGSTAEHVVRDCPCSVFAIKPPGFVQGQPYVPLADTEAVHEKEERRRVSVATGSGN